MERRIIKSFLFIHYDYSIGIYSDRIKNTIISAETKHDALLRFMNEQNMALVPEGILNIIEL